MLAVVGAKLSEGLNFSDDLARAVVVVGLPYANLGSVELKERMSYLTELEKKNGGPRAGCKDAGAELYENQCIKAVNQSIGEFGRNLNSSWANDCEGRAIRHRHDWAALILIDERYSSSRIRSKLPSWISDGITVVDTFGHVMKELGQFYRKKRDV